MTVQPSNTPAGDPPTGPPRPGDSPPVIPGGLPPGNPPVGKTLVDPFEVDPGLHKTVTRNRWLGYGFCLATLAGSLTNQVHGVQHLAHLSLGEAWVTVGTIELGGIYFMATAGIRRRLSEPAGLLMAISGLFGVFAVSTNYLTHTGVMSYIAAVLSLGAFFAFFAIEANARRDLDRKLHRTSNTTNKYGVRNWIRHPFVTARAKDIAARGAESDQAIGPIKSLDLARDAIATGRRDRGFIAIIRRKYGKNAKVVAATLDLAEVARGAREATDSFAVGQRYAAEIGTVVQGTVLTDTPGEIPGGDGPRALPPGTPRKRGTPPQSSPRELPPGIPPAGSPGNPRTVSPRALPPGTPRGASPRARTATATVPPGEVPPFPLQGTQVWDTYWARQDCPAADIDAVVAVSGVYPWWLPQGTTPKTEEIRSVIAPGTTGGGRVGRIRVHIANLKAAMFADEFADEIG